MRVHVWVVVVLVFVLPVARAGVIDDENAKPGTSEWKVPAPAANGEIEGYASLTSAAPGETIRFYVRANDPHYTIEIFRMGWYGGMGGRRMTQAVRRASVTQPMPSPDPATGLIECNWGDPYLFVIPNDWVSGVYLAKLTGQPGGLGAYIIFVVRSTPDRAARFVVQTSATTYQAYNDWGGKSLYSFNSIGGRAFKVSFNRPYVPNAGAGDFLYGGEYSAVRFLEREGYDVTYTTDLDTHERGADLLRAAGFIDIGHDEYWTWQMRDAVEYARDAGVNLAFLSANTCYWQIRLEPSPISGEPDRTIAAWKEDALTRDPVLLDGDPSNDHLATTLWRNAPVFRPEDEMIGTMYTYATIRTDLVIGDTSHWVFDNSGLKSGDHLPMLLGYEVDRSTVTSYPGTIVLTHSPFTQADGTPNESNMTIYTAHSGATVFATGTIYWCLGLDDFNAAERLYAPPSAPAQQITRNVLARMEQRAVRRRRVVE